MNKEKTDLKDIDCFLLDMDGTIYLDMDLIDGTLEFLAELKKQGKRAMYITNKSARTAGEYVEKLKILGISATTEDFFTSANAIVYFLNKMDQGKKLFVIGTPALENYLAGCGYTIIKTYEEEPEKRPDFVLLGFDMTVTFEKLRIACDYLREDVRYLATHPDMVCPAAKGHVFPDAGSFMKLIEGTTGRLPELIAGKPDPCMINIICEKHGYDKKRVAVVGDRLNTDIMAGVNAGITTICVLTGETTTEQLKTSDVHPDYVVDSIKDVWEAIR